MIDFQFCVWVYKKTIISKTYRNQEPHLAKEIKLETQGKNRLEKPWKQAAAFRFDVVGNKEPSGVSEQGSDVDKTVIKEDEKGQIKGRD